MPKDFRHWEPPADLRTQARSVDPPAPRPAGEGPLPWKRRVDAPPKAREPVKISARNTWGAEWHQMLRGEGWAVHWDADDRTMFESMVRPLEILPGVLEASVGRSGERPSRVQIRMKPLTESERTRLARQVTDDRTEASIAADLKRGDIPAALVDAADRHQLPLVPRRLSSLIATCTCGNARLPCDHLLAVHLVLARRLYREPQLLLELRGVEPVALAELMERIRAESQQEVKSAAKTDPYAAIDGPEPDWSLLAKPPAPRPPLPSPEGWRAAESFDALAKRLLEPARSRS